ncbi:MAG: hypothetical protein JKY37_31450 [Nannocystaceae bacterium]|nr:hypothetical protein [Nannocystaceae bacterium]
MARKTRFRRTFVSATALLFLGEALACDSDDGDPQASSDTQSQDDGGSGDSTDTADTANSGTSDIEMVDEDAVLQASLAYKTTMVQLSDEATGSLHALADTVQFYIGAEYSDTYLSIDPAAPTAVTFPEGTLIVKENLDAAGDPDGFFAMYKAFSGYDPAGNDWYWLRVNGEGATGNAGKVGFCIDCHSGGPAAVSDLVFGVPLDNRL